jgi:hypothetical protein
MKKFVLFCFTSTVILFVAGIKEKSAQLTNATKNVKFNSAPLSVTSMVLNKANLNKSEDSAFIKKYYLQKNCDNKITSLCLVGGGLKVAGIGVLTFSKDYELFLKTKPIKKIRQIHLLHYL